jgi:alkylation response protein AidB-like acyl-CoA dehydrogenase
VASMRTTAVRDGDGYVLNGSKMFITNASHAAFYSVFAVTDPGAGHRGISSFVVDRDTPGVSVSKHLDKMGQRATDTAQVTFEDVRVPAANRLGAEGEGFRIAMNGLNGGRLNIGACSLGGARAALDAAITHLGQRQAFGARLLDSQALQFRLADMATEWEAARLLLWRAASALDAAEPDAVRLCAMAKRLATDTGFAVANSALQMFGGYGYLAEYGIEKIVRDLRVHQILEGTNEIMRMIVARGLTEAA